MVCRNTSYLSTTGMQKRDKVPGRLKQGLVPGVFLKDSGSISALRVLFKMLLLVHSFLQTLPSCSIAGSGRRSSDTHTLSCWVLTAPGSPVFGMRGLDCCGTGKATPCSTLAAFF